MIAPIVRDDSLTKLVSMLVVAVVASALLWSVDQVASISRYLRAPFRVVIQLDTWATKIFSQLMLPVFWWTKGVNSLQQVAYLESTLADQVVDRVKMVELEQQIKELSQQAEVQISDGRAELLPFFYTNHGAYVFLPDNRSQIHFVTDPKGVLVGLVNDEVSSMRRVQTVVDSEVKIPVSVLGRNAKGIFEGGVNTSVMTGILQSEEVLVGDVVVTMASDRMPANIVIGTVESVEVKPSEVTKEAKVKALYQVDKYVLGR